MKINRKIALELIPTEGNPRNSEGAFISLNDGKILFAYSRYEGESSDDDARAVIASYISDDGGNSWSDNGIMFTPEDHKARNIMSVSLLRLSNGDIGIFYYVKKDRLDACCYMRRSNDEGREWSDAICCIPGLGYYEGANDRAIRLATGRLIVPISFHRLLLRDKNLSEVFDPNSFDSSPIACFVISDDDGHTWRFSKQSCSMPLPSGTGLVETAIVEMLNGNIWALFRTDMGFQYQSFSYDGGDTWTPVYPSRFSSPNSPMNIKNIPGTETLLAVWNPVPAIGRKYTSMEWMYSNTEGSSSFFSFTRTPLVGAVSRDGGKTWEEPFVIEDDLDRGFCYPSIYFANGNVLLAYCCGGEEDKGCLCRLRISKLEMHTLKY